MSSISHSDIIASVKVDGIAPRRQSSSFFSSLDDKVYEHHFQLDAKDGAHMPKQSPLGPIGPYAYRYLHPWGAPTSS